MKKTALFTALIAAAGMASTAQAAPTVYGEVNASVEVKLAQDKPNETNTVMDLKSRKARIGVKGDQAMDNGLKAIYKIELNGDLVQIQSDASKKDDIKFGTRYMGLEGDFGQVTVGKMATPMDDSTNDADVSNNLIGLDSSNTGSRGKNIKYVSPDLGGVKVAVSLLPHGAKDDKGAKNGSFGISSSVAYEKDGIYVALAFENGASSDYFEPKGAKQPVGIRLVGKFSMIENLQLGFVYDNYKLDKKVNNTILASAAYDMDGIEPHVQLTHLSHNADNDKSSELGLLLGANYKLADKVTAYSDFGYKNYDSGVSGSKAQSAMALDFGLKVKF